ncbi:hypothetical protein PMAYCL1PPCAC_08911 [Pristionchus mayeri]|uniref:Uncharacterized protein n=1 Tax=Pristionchus mayeri TaxID=1317129 RepID=A0AAN4ZDB6_9BILA|nr:hypothetical protein PMAYCL1PPCAC_08911 [Pristionchus mayeri]
MKVSTSSGTVYYENYSSPHRLFVKWKGNEIDAELPSDEISEVHTHGKSLYFLANSQIFKMEFSATLVAMTSTCLRRTHDAEGLENGFITWNEEDRRYVCRMSRNPSDEKVLVDVPEEDLNGLKLIGIHNSKVIYASRIEENLEPTILKLSDHVFVVEIPGRTNFLSYGDDSSRYFYIAKRQSFIVFDTEMMEFKLELCIENAGCILSFSICNRIIAFQDESNDNLLNAELPMELIEEHKEAEIQPDQIIDPNPITKLEDRIRELEDMLIEFKLGALYPSKPSLQFKEIESLAKSIWCTQLENGTMVYFDEEKPFDIFTMINGNRTNLGLQNFKDEENCTFRGCIGNHAYFSSVRNHIIRFFKATLHDDRFDIEQIREMSISDCSIFFNQPYYYLEEKEWSVFNYEDNLEEGKGDKFYLFEVDNLSRYEKFYHRGILYLFRETQVANIVKVTANVVIVEGPLVDLDAISFFTFSSLAFIYILNSDEKVLLALDTTELSVTKIDFEPPTESMNHSIVGVCNDVLTIMSESASGRIISSTKIA